MKANTSFDDASLKKALRDIRIDRSDMVMIEGAAAKPVINLERQLVPVDTAATQNSVGSHITEASEKRVVDEIGPEMNYDPYVEYGVQSKPNYPAQPFVRPAAVQGRPDVVRVIGHTFGKLVIERWPL